MPETSAPSYQQRCPERTLLYRIVQQHLESFLAQVAEHGKRLPKYVEQEFRRYLECGIFAHGFSRAECASCGHELLLPFSCKLRGACPSCNARRACNTAAHLVVHVLPPVPIRQWVLSVPFEMRMLLAAKSEALSAVGRIFVQEIHRWQRGMALLRTKHKVQCGAVVFPQRFGGSLNLNVHYHVVVPDVVFLTHDGDGPATPLELAPPERADLEEVLHNTACRVIAWLKRRGHVRQDNDDLHALDEERSALDACLQSSLGVGQLHPAPSRNRTVTSGEPSPPKRPKGDAVAAYGFNLHAGVKVSAGSAEALERLLRYCARAPLSLERLAQPDDETITYQVKHGNQLRAMTLMQFMVRLAALIPPPRHPLIRFHGVFAPHSRFRKQVVPTAAEASKEQPATCGQEDPPQPKTPPDAAAHIESLAANTVPNTTAFPARETQLISRIDWATLLQRVYTIDALACPRCGDRMRFTDLYELKHLAREELKKRGLTTHPPPLARARSPDSTGE